ncbi:MAG: hypothetical protein AAF217_03260 [Pseudomonadota bacterium]
MTGWKFIFPAVIIVIAGICYVFFVYELGENPASTSEVEIQPVMEPARQVRDVTPEKMLQAPAVDTAMLERLPAFIPPAPPKKEKPPQQDRWAQLVIPTPGKLQSGKTQIILSDIKPIPLAQKCVDQSGVTWPCGMLARTELRQFIRGRAIECNPMENETTTIKTRCRLAGYDISAWLVLTGWAEPTGNFFQDELAQAKEKGRGQWRAVAP